MSEVGETSLLSDELDKSLSVICDPAGHSSLCVCVDCALSGGVKALQHLLTFAN